MQRLPQYNGASALTTHQLQVERRESRRANQVYALTTPSYRWRGERDIEPVSVCSHHTPATVERREVIEQSVYALTTHQLQVERRERHRANQVYALATQPRRGGEGEERHRDNHVCSTPQYNQLRWGKKDIEHKGVSHTPLQVEKEKRV